tara:strand:- start:5495 stop:6154 length:660 start_codon:yes stop_codon:yes gene_type:complete
MPPRKRDAERTRAKIFSAAIYEFGRNGYTGARIERIVKRSGCNIRLIYYHFGSKIGLYREVVEGAYADLRASEAELEFNVDDPMASLLRLLEFTMHYFADHPELEGIIRSENETQGRVVATSSSVGASGKALTARLVSLVKSGVSKGVFRSGIDPAHLYLTITAVSRFHLANAYSMSAVLGVDMQDKVWRESWNAYAADLISRYVAVNGSSTVSSNLLP